MARCVPKQAGPSAGASGIGPGGEDVWWRNDGVADANADANIDAAVDTAAASGMVHGAYACVTH